MLVQPASSPRRGAFPFDLTVVAAVLAVIGYSLNDTVVAFDRIRENFFKLRGIEADESMNVSINEMLARTLITGVTTLLVLVALLVLGGESIAPFSIALIVGVIVGTYSSIYTASAVALMLDVNATAVVLFAFGTGPIKGFAITLSLGIITSMFTAIIGTRSQMRTAQPQQSMS